MMVMMGCFAILRLDERALVLLPGNIAVALALGIGAVAVAMNRPFSLPVGLGAAALTAIVGGLGVRGGFAQYMRLPGYPLIWVVIGLYIAFRLAINHQHQQRMQTSRRQGAAAAAAAEAEAEAEAGDAGGK